MIEPAGDREAIRFSIISVRFVGAMSASLPRGTLFPQPDWSVSIKNKNKNPTKTFSSRPGSLFHSFAMNLAVETAFHDPNNNVAC